MRSHASTPFAIPVGGSVVRVFFSSRDERNRSSIGSLWIDLEKPDVVLQLDADPLVSPGERGLFDDSGASMGSVVAHEDGALALYYVGWNLGVTVPWRNSIGLALSEDGGQTFRKAGRAPLLDRSAEDPFTLSYPFVMFSPPEGKWIMWYGSHRSWGGSHDMDHVIKRADSDDGSNWKRGERAVLEFAHEGEFAMCRPSVLRTAEGYRMWFAYRGVQYRIGCAESTDGFTWSRADDVCGLEPSDSGWDSEAVTYPHVFECAGETFLLYNGNGYGRSGFGLCVAKG